MPKRLAKYFLDNKYTEEAVMPELDGFTLWKVEKGYQLSTRVVGEAGWNIRIVSNEFAQSLFDRINEVEDVVVEQPRPTIAVAKPVFTRGN